MLTRKRVETFVQIEMTESQADTLAVFFSYLQSRHVDEVCKQMHATAQYRECVTETLNDLQAALCTAFS